MAKVEIPMPKMGESITEGSVIVWHKKVGDTVELDETLLEIGTDKVDTDVPSPVTGTVAEILTPEGETVPVGHIIALIQTEQESSNGVGTVELSEEEVEEIDVDSSMEMQDVPVVMPKMGESITEGTVITWHKQVGDQIELDETLLEIGTDKVDTDVPAPVTGILKEILVPEGDTVDVGTTIALIGANTRVPVVDRVSESPIPVQQEVPDVSDQSSTASIEESVEGARHTEDGRFLSPLVRSMAQAERIPHDELTQINGSGRGGRITKKM